MPSVNKFFDTEHWWQSFVFAHPIDGHDLVLVLDTVTWALSGIKSSPRRALFFIALGDIKINNKFSVNVDFVV